MRSNTPNSKKTKESKATSESKKGKKRKGLTILLWIVIVLFSIGAIVIIVLLLLRKCGGQTTYNIKILQPEGEYQNWHLTVNDKDGEINVKQNEELNIKVKNEGTENYINNYSIFNGTENEVGIYYIKVSDQKTGQEEWTSSVLQKVSDDEYRITFDMIWDHDIVVQVDSKTSFEDEIYTKVGDDVTYIYDVNSLCDSALPIKRYSTLSQTWDDIERDAFDANIWIGSEISAIPSSFLTGCSIFNGTITFNKGKLATINNNFLNGCKAFNQEIVFPESLTAIVGNFMYNCEAFNHPINTKNIEKMLPDDASGTSTFLFNGKSFNSTITFGSKLLWISSNFLSGCTSFNQDIVLPSNIQKVFPGFMYGCDSMTSTIQVECLASAYSTGDKYTCSTGNSNADCYTKGIKITGTYAEQWKTTYPDLKSESETEKIYRKLIKN